jgi:hypothetical protein
MLRHAGLTFDDLATLGDTRSDTRIENLAAMGTVDDLAEETEKMLKAGVDHVCYGHPLAEDPISAATEVGEKLIGRF